jgi:hypothetical protein
VATEVNKRHIRIEKSLDGELFPLATADGCDQSQDLNLTQAESVRSPPRTILGGARGTVSAMSKLTILGGEQLQKDFEDDAHTITKPPVEERDFLTYMERTRFRGKVQEFIAPWSEAAKAQDQELEVDGHPVGIESDDLKKGEVVSCANSLGEKSDNKKAYSLARTMNRLHLDGREPWWRRADEKSMRRSRNRLSFKRAHYSRNTDDQSDNESLTSRSDTLVHLEESLHHIASEFPSR